MAAAQLFLCWKRALAALCLGLLRGKDEDMWQWISRREERGVFHQLIRELEVGDVVAYKVSQRLRYPSSSLYRENFWLSESLWSTASNSSSPSAASAMFFLICRVAALQWKPITSVEFKFVARQVEASVVIRATKLKFVAESRTRVHFSQHVASTCNIVFCCETSWARRW